MAERAIAVRGETFFTARVARLDRLQRRHRVGRARVDAVDEEEARIAGRPRGLADGLPDFLGVELAEALAAPGAATPGQGPAGLREHRVLLAVVEGMHERVGDRNGDVEVRDAAVALAGHRVIDAEDRHVGAASRSSLLHVLGGGVVDTQEADGPGRHAACRPHARVLRAQAGERKPGAASRLMDQRGVVHRHEDPAEIVGDR